MTVRNPLLVSPEDLSSHERAVLQIAFGLLARAYLDVRALVGDDAAVEERLQEVSVRRMTELRDIFRSIGAGDEVIRMVAELLADPLRGRLPPIPDTGGVVDRRH